MKLLMPLLLAAAQVATPSAPTAPTPSQIVAGAPAYEWVTIASDDLLVMELAPDAEGRARRVVIQLIAAPFSRGWVANIRTLARAHWWDGTAVTRVQDNYVAQWGDPDGDDKTKAKPLPTGLRTMGEGEYVSRLAQTSGVVAGAVEHTVSPPFTALRERRGMLETDPYVRSGQVGFVEGWPAGGGYGDPTVWPVHCYASVGVGRGLSPDTGTGAELYTVIGHAPRHLDRNIAVVGRVVEGIEHLSSLPRGTGALGVYETAGERTAIRSIRLASDLPAGERPRLQYLSTQGASFAAYADARANRRDAFFIEPAGGADVCNVPVPVRRVP